MNFESRQEALLIDLQHLPCISYFSVLKKHKIIYLESEESYIKQSYRNRCYILTSNKIDRLSVPVKYKNGLKTREVEIDYVQKWQNRHWRAIKSAYAKTPFFEFYGDYFEKIIYTNYKFLYDLNMDLLTLCLKILNIKIDIRHTDTYYHEVPENIADFRSIIHPKKESGIKNVQFYNQIFGSGFTKNLSIIDLLFNEGQNSSVIIDQQAKKMIF
ncbi:MAG: WbqC family protein [Flammeovirgaceae bacterium]|nr:WbqC family protein [Flammeovirgaceae bacterium]